MAHDEWKDAMESRVDKLEAQLEYMRNTTVDNIFKKIDRLSEKYSDQQAKLTGMLMLSSLTMLLLGFLVYKVYEVSSKLKF